MFVVTKDTEKTLLQVLKDYAQNGAAHRCLYFRFSELDTPREEWSQPFTQALEKAGDSGDLTHMYICYDQDVFVLMRGATHKTLRKIVAQLTSEIDVPFSEGLAGIFDLGVDCQKIETLCKRKLAVLENIQIEKHKKQQAKKKKKEREAVHTESTFSVYRTITLLPVPTQ